MGVCHSPGRMQQPVKHHSPCSASGGRAVSQALTYETGVDRAKDAPLSSAFDLITFQLLQHLHTAGTISHQMMFHAGWFTESLLTQILAVLVIRTGRVPLPQSRPAAAVSLACLAGCGLAIALPYTPVGTWLGLAPVPRHPHPPAPHHRRLPYGPANRQNRLPPRHRPLAMNRPMRTR